MNRKAVGSYVDDGTLYGTDKKALKIGLKEQRRKERKNEKIAKKAYRENKKRNRAYNKALWNNRKRELYNQAHSMNYYDEAEYNLMNRRTHYNEKDIYKEQKRLRNKQYRRLVRIETKFWR